jgi:hypothetical protein
MTETKNWVSFILLGGHMAFLLRKSILAIPENRETAESLLEFPPCPSPD